MKINFLIYIIFFCFVNLLFGGCYSIKPVNIEDNNSVKIYKIETDDGKIIEFKNSKLGYAFLSTNQVVSINISGEYETYPMSHIKKYYTERFEPGGVTIVAAGIALAVALLFLLTWAKY